MQENKKKTIIEELNLDLDFVGDLELIQEIVFKEPPTKYTVNLKRPKMIRKKLITKKVYYLTANLFYGSDIHFHEQSKLVKEVKYYMMHDMRNLPKLEKMRVHVIYLKKQDTWDLDNKGYFWLKMFLDILKTPSNKQIKNAMNKKKRIPSLSILKDDTVRYIDDLRISYRKGSHLLIFRIYGRRSNEQKKLNI